MRHTQMNRRSILKVLAGGVAGSMVFRTAKLAWAGDEMVVGFIAVDNWNDYGYTQSHLESANALDALDHVRVLNRQNRQ